VFPGDVDGDGEAEVVVFLPDELRVLGDGPTAAPSKDELLGRDPESRTLGSLENPYLATALEMAAMDWKEQALRLFQQAREAAANAFEARRALLGEADCLIKLGRPGEAVDLYRRMVDSSSLGITEELITLVELLKKEGNWKEILSLLRTVQAGVTLPEETRRWVNETAAKAEPLTRVENRIACLPAEGFDPSYLCRHPLKSPGSRGGGDFEFLADGARRSAFGRLVRWDGGPLRLEARILFQRQDWTCHLWFGMFRAGRVGEPTYAPPALQVLVETGLCTNLPAVFVTGEAPGLGGTSRLLREYPQKFPAELSFVLEYAPAMGLLSLRVRDETHGESWAMSAPLQGSMPPGKYVLGLAGSCERASSDFQARFTVKRLEAFTASRDGGPDPWEPAPGAFRVLRAGAALALGDWKNALELARQAGPGEADPSEILAIPYWEAQDRDPSPAAAAKLIEAFALLRSKDDAGFEKAFGAALEADAGRALWHVSRSFPGLPPEEGEAAGRALRAILSAEGGRLAIRAVADFRGNPGRRSSDFQGFPAQAWTAMEEALKGAAAAPDPEALPATLFGVLSRLFRAELVEAVFRGTAFQPRARLQRLLSEAGEFEHAGDLASSRAAYERMTAEFPEDPTALNAAAWSLVGRKDPSPEDARRALEWARRAVDLVAAAKPPNPQELACNLDTLARAHFWLGELEEAVRVQERAAANLDDASDPELRKALLRNLESYRKVLAEKKAKGG
jgi:tetratricopeptide (TPR) repeat protein